MALIASFVALSEAGAAQSRKTPAAVERLTIPPDYPPADERIWALQRTGLTVKLAREALASAPDAPETLDLLIRARLPDEALDVFRRIVDRRPKDLEVALGLGVTLFNGTRFDALRSREYVVPDLVERAARTLRQLPREEAARAARALLTFDQSLRRQSPAERSTRQRDFVMEWQGTEAALLTEVDVISSGPLTPDRLDELQSFARAHPRTTAAAKAQYLRGFDLAHNAMSLKMERSGADPLDRLLLVRSIVDDLEGGSYPRCEWVEKAPELMIGFYAHEPKYAEQSVNQTIEAYEQFAKTHFVLDRNFPTRSGVGYLITSKLADLYKLRGDGPESVERFFDTLARDPAIADEVRHLQALYYMDRARATRAPAERSDYTVRARATLRAINDSSTGLAQRRALANLGVLEQWAQRQQNAPNPAAIQHLMDYVRKYPESPWAWVAALRLGKAHEARDAWDSASQVYADAAQRYASAPVAAALAHEYAAQAHEALGQFNQAIGERERAIQRWDDDYGSTYSLYMMREPRPDEGFMAMGADDAAVVKSAVVARLAQSKETLRAPGGALMERARWELAHDQRDAAIVTLAQLVKEQPQSPNAASARALSHRARVDRALEAGSAADLESLANEPYDYWICASKMARAAMLWRDGQASAADALMTDALSEWHRQQGNGVDTAALADTAKDVLEIRNVVFRPNGDGPFSGTSWELRSLAPSKTPFFIVNPDVRVKLPGGETQVTVRRAFPDYSNVLFFDTEQLAFFDRLMARVGGTERAVPATVMSVPNQPAGRSAELLKFLQQFFPARPGHWGGWMFQTFPMITRIEFEDAARTHAAVFVTVGYEGATLIFEKQGGVWTFKEMTGRWIT